MLRICILLSTLVIIQAQEKFFEKYTFAKTMSQCFGSSAYQNYLYRISDAKRDCSYRGNNPFESYNPTFGPTNNLPYGPTFSTERPFFNPSSFRPNFQPGGTIRPYLTRPTSPPVDVVIPGRGGINDPFRFPINVNDFLKSYSKQGGNFYGDNNQLVDGGEIRDAVERVGLALQNFTCVLSRLDLIDSRLNINYDMIVNNYYQSALDPQLRNDLIDGVNYCRQLNSCLPEDKSPISYELQRVISFIKCERKTRLSACFKNDLRRSIHQFDISALPYDGNLTTDLEKLMTIIIGSESLDELELI